MSPIPKQKLCWHCEGSVFVHEENCPYCGVYLNPEAEKEDEFSSIELDDSHDEITHKRDETDTLFSFLKPLTMLLLGSTLSVFSLILFLFNQNGVFTLQWNADAWYLYLLVSLPLLWLGWKSLKFVSDKENF